MLDTEFLVSLLFRNCPSKCAFKALVDESGNILATDGTVESVAQSKKWNYNIILKKFFRCF